PCYYFFSFSVLPGAVCCCVFTCPKWVEWKRRGSERRRRRPESGQEQGKRTQENRRERSRQRPLLPTSAHVPHQRPQCCTQRDRQKQQPQQQQLQGPPPQQPSYSGGAWRGGPQHGPHSGYGGQHQHRYSAPPRPPQPPWRPPYGHANVMHAYSAMPYGGPAYSNEYGGWE
ncbi:unnamed protein product, partial [Ectocarpus sp. 8 AP-2014]